MPPVDFSKDFYATLYQWPVQDWILIVRFAGVWYIFRIYNIAITSQGWTSEIVDLLSADFISMSQKLSCLNDKANATNVQIIIQRPSNILEIF